MIVKNKGLRQYFKVNQNYTTFDINESWITSVTEIFKNAPSVSIQKYCLHLKRMIKIQSDPPMAECKQCLKDIISKNKEK